MKTNTTHPSNFGSIATNCEYEPDGDIIYHDSEHYSKTSNSELEMIAREHRFKACRNAAKLEIAQRKIDSWLALTS